MSAPVAVRRVRVGPAVATAVGIGVALLAVAGPWFAGPDVGAVVDIPFAPAGPGLPLGTDASGRDVLTLVLAGGRPLVLVPVLATIVTAVLGTALGAGAAAVGPRSQRLVRRLDALLLAVPPVVTLLVLLHGLGYSAPTLVAAVALTGVPFVSRIARAATASVLRTGYVEVARALGHGPLRICVREVLPVIVGPIVADAGTRLAIAVTLVASASFLGFGPDLPDWAAMINENMEGVVLNPWAVVVPAAGLAALTVGANLTLDALAARLPR